MVLPMSVQNPPTDGPNDTPISQPQGGPSASSPSLSELQFRCAQSYADQAHRLYKNCAELAVQLDDAVQEFLKHPGDTSLEGAQIAWRKARRVYGQTEVFRFYGGPIDNPVDGVETLINAWPLDENYIDSPGSGTGIINDSEHYPNLDATLLTLLNERGGEANVSIGWHAVEFLLWGVDTNSEGPGQRAWQDFSSSHRDHADRRGAISPALLQSARAASPPIGACLGPRASRQLPRKILETSARSKLSAHLGGNDHPERF